MNQIRIGNFIQQRRKELGMTQKELEINVNELLSGERIKEEHLKERMEENMLSLIKEGSEEKQKSQWSIIGMVFGIILLIIAMIFVINMAGNWRINYYIDIPSFLIVVGITIIVLAISGQFKNFFYGFKVAVTKNVNPANIKQSENAFIIAMVSNLFAGGFGFVTGFIAVLTNISDLRLLGPGLAVCVLSVFYPAVINLIILVFYAKLKTISDI